MTDSVRAPSGQALAVPATPANAVDGPSGFDPSRIGTLVAALRSLLPDVRLVMEEMGDGENCPGAAYIGAVTKLPEKRVLEIMRALRTFGLADYGPLCDIDSEEGYVPRGSGYWLWPSGFDFLRAMDEADAIATEARRAETGNTVSVHEGAGPKDIAQGTQP